ncbi:uncharacterized [Tachysurus ichikawai]
MRPSLRRRTAGTSSDLSPCAVPSEITIRCSRANSPREDAESSQETELEGSGGKRGMAEPKRYSVIVRGSTLSSRTDAAEKRRGVICSHRVLTTDRWRADSPQERCYGYSLFFRLTKSPSVKKPSAVLSWQPLKASARVVKCAAEISSLPLASRHYIDGAVTVGCLSPARATCRAYKGVTLQRLRLYV